MKRRRIRQVDAPHHFVQDARESWHESDEVLRVGGRRRERLGIDSDKCGRG